MCLYELRRGFKFGLGYDIMAVVIRLLINTAKVFFILFYYILFLVFIRNITKDVDICGFKYCHVNYSVVDDDDDEDDDVNFNTFPVVLDYLLLLD